MIKTAIIGASGYSGAELTGLLSSREDVSIKHLFANTAAGKIVADVYPSLAEKVDMKYELFNPKNTDLLDLVFISLPSGEAMQLVNEVFLTTQKIIDLGGDFRLLNSKLYEQFYKKQHTSAELLNQSVYGLPELNKLRIKDACLIANPGCYPTSIILALLPALKNRIISPENIVINSLSGISGAGKTSSTDLSFVEINENVRAYKIGTHQHIPEIQTVLEKATEQKITFSFVPNLIPITRGIYTTIYADLCGSFSEDEIFSFYRQYYTDDPFIRIKQEIPQIRNVVHTNFCDIFLTIDKQTGKLIIISVIDNLIKGAAGQAIQNMNIMFGLPETQGFNFFKEKQRAS